MDYESEYDNHHLNCAYICYGKRCQNRAIIMTDDDNVGYCKQCVKKTPLGIMIVTSNR